MHYRYGFKLKTLNKWFKNVRANSYIRRLRQGLYCGGVPCSMLGSWDRYFILTTLKKSKGERGYIFHGGQFRRIPLKQRPLLGKIIGCSPPGSNIQPSQFIRGLWHKFNLIGKESPGGEDLIWVHSGLRNFHHHSLAIWRYHNRGQARKPEFFHSHKNQVSISHLFQGPSSWPKGKATELKPPKRINLRKGFHSILGANKGSWPQILIPQGTY